MSDQLDLMLVKPFVLGVIQTLKVQCGVLPKLETVFLLKKEDVAAPNIDIAGIVGITGAKLNGSLAICFPEKSFLNVMGKLLGENFESLTPSLEDGAGELANIIFGFAKKQLNESGHAIQMAIPNVVRGSGIRLRHVTGVPVLCLPFSSELGPFHLEIGAEELLKG